MIKIWYDPCWQATVVQYNEVKLRFFDREGPWEELSKIFEAYPPECSTGIGKMEIPYSDEVWQTLLAEGEQEFDD